MNGTACPDQQRTSAILGALWNLGRRAGLLLRITKHTEPSVCPKQASGSKVRSKATFRRRSEMISDEERIAILQAGQLVAKFSENLRRLGRRRDIENYSASQRRDYCRRVAANCAGLITAAPAVTRALQAASRDEDRLARLRDLIIRHFGVDTLAPLQMVARAQFSPLVPDAEAGYGTVPEAEVALSSLQALGEIEEDIGALDEEHRRAYVQTAAFATRCVLLHLPAVSNAMAMAHAAAETEQAMGRLVDEVLAVFKCEEEGRRRQPTNRQRSPELQIEVKVPSKKTRGGNRNG